MNLAIDTNLLVSAVLLPHSVPGAVLSAWRASAFIWVCCDEQWQELSGTFARPHILARIANGVEPVQTLLREMKANCRWATLNRPLPRVCTDANDDFLFALHDQGHVNTIVSGDKAVLALKGKYPVLSARELIDRL